MRSFVRSKILDPSRSISSADCRPAASPICCTARKRIRAIEVCISCRFRSLIQPTSDDRRSTSKRIESGPTVALHCNGRSHIGLSSSADYSLARRTMLEFR